MNELLFEEFCLADPVFFDTQSRTDGARSVFAQSRGPVPDGWQRFERDVWVHLLPVGHRMPQQGWKVHVSACLDNAARVLDTTHRYCLANRVPFKFLLGRNVLRAHNQKYAPRSASGKLVTIYPAAGRQLRAVLEELGHLLEGEPGPYILTDLRWGGGPLYVRYGGFVELFCPDENGVVVPAISGPDGRLIPDRRTPAFRVPDWVELPDFLAPHLAARNTGDADFPYRVESALHFSNGGGVYLARRGDDRRVVLKEARPHAGLDGADRDAVTRLRIERDALRRLAGVPGVPELYEHRAVWEHEFLVQEYLPGDTLFAWMAEHYPLTNPTPTTEDIEEYTRRAVAVTRRVERVVAAIHARGMAMGDLHPTNIIINADDEVRLTDFEAATDASSTSPSTVGYPGFEAPHKAGCAADRHAVAALKLWLFMPLVELTALVPAKISTYLDIIADRFPLPEGYLDEIRAELTPTGGSRLPVVLGGTVEVDLAQPVPDWSAACKSMAEAILQSATPQRQDRLFPGDPQQFINGGFGFGYGAAGVLWVLDRTGAGRYPRYEQWLLAAAKRVSQENPGFYDGLCGLAFVLERFGHTDAVPPLLERALGLVDVTRDVSLHSGLAGIGLTALTLAGRTGETGYADAALRVAARLGDAIRSGEPYGIDVLINSQGQPVERLGARAGLLRGWSGAALMLLRCYERTGEPGYLDLAVAAVHRDLDLCLLTPDGSLQVDGGFRVLGHLDVGSMGIALVATEVLSHRPDDRLEASLPVLARAGRAEFVIDPQLLNGRAGLMAALARLAAWRPELDLATAVDLHLRRLAWHAVPYRGHLAFPGRRLRRLSMDLATGSAGILLAVDAVVTGRTDFLPFLASSRAPADRRGPAETSPTGRR
jgi:hypothetical protein